MADEFNGTVTIKDRMLLALGALEGMPKRMEQVNDKLEKCEKAQSEQQIRNEQIDNRIRGIEDRERKTCVHDNCPLWVDLKAKGILEKVESNTAARNSAAAKKGYWKDKLIGMAIAITLLIAGKYLSVWLGL